MGYLALTAKHVSYERSLMYHTENTLVSISFLSVTPVVPGGGGGVVEQYAAQRKHNTMD